MKKSAFVLAAIAVGSVVGLAAVALTREDDERAAEPKTTTDPGPIHVHGLGIDPADNALLVATHTGMYRVPRGERRAVRVGSSRQDTMGFTVVGPRFYLGSGHPDPQTAATEDLPPHLGLIESRDAGRTWRTIALSGEADFHVLRVAGKRVYGYDASNDRLLVSNDGGTTWNEAARPAPLLDLAVDIANSRRVVASGEGGLYVSANEGRTWRRVGPRIGLLAWPATDRLYLVDVDGEVLRSTDAGRAWTTVGAVDGQPAAFLAASTRELYVALHDGKILRSRDGGKSWAVRSSP